MKTLCIKHSDLVDKALKVSKTTEKDEITLLKNKIGNWKRLCNHGLDILKRLATAGENNASRVLSRGGNDIIINTLGEELSKISKSVINMTIYKKDGIEFDNTSAMEAILYAESGIDDMDRQQQTTTTQQCNTYTTQSNCPAARCVWDNPTSTCKNKLPSTSDDISSVELDPEIVAAIKMLSKMKEKNLKTLPDEQSDDSESLKERVCTKPKNCNKAAEGEKCVLTPEGKSQPYCDPQGCKRHYKFDPKNGKCICNKYESPHYVYPFNLFNKLSKNERIKCLKDFNHIPSDCCSCSECEMDGTLKQKIWHHHCDEEKKQTPISVGYDCKKFGVIDRVGCWIKNLL